jgi:N6-L-threonylcarbamoyladenine synthase
MSTADGRRGGRTQGDTCVPNNPKWDTCVPNGARENICRPKRPDARAYARARVGAAHKQQSCAPAYQHESYATAHQQQSCAGAGTPSLILALETSCDDTCAAVLDGEGAIRSNVISSQEAHNRFGGVVPEIASRGHLEIVNLIVRSALERAGATLEEIDLIAATRGPGLVGALLVGFATAKALAAARELPLAAVDHLQGHVAANFIVGAAPRASGPERPSENPGTAPPEALRGALKGDPEGSIPQGANGSHASHTASADAPRTPFEPPFVCLIASGGHTLLAHVKRHDGFEVLGSTLDDAAGEAFDKGARMLGLGYPGGVALERLAKEGDPTMYPFTAGGPRAGLGAGGQAFARSLDFSFAGLKTALLYRVRDLDERELAARAADLAASYQNAIVERLLERAERALRRTGLRRLAVGGGVAANGELRRRLGELDAEVHVPERVLCTDNAAMIASAARFTERLAYPDYLPLDVYATGERPS